MMRTFKSFEPAKNDEVLQKRLAFLKTLRLSKNDGRSKYDELSEKWWAFLKTLRSSKNDERFKIDEVLQKWWGRPERFKSDERFTKYKDDQKRWDQPKLQYPFQIVKSSNSEQYFFSQTVKLLRSVHFIWFFQTVAKHLLIGYLLPCKNLRAQSSRMSSSRITNITEFTRSIRERNPNFDF